MNLNVEPLNLNVEPLNLNVEPLNLNVEPLNLNVEPLNLDVEPLNLDVEPLNLNVEPLNLNVEPLNLNVEPLNLNVEPLNLKFRICYSKQSSKYCIAFPNHIRYIIAPSSLAGRGLGVGFLYFIQHRTAIFLPHLPPNTKVTDLTPTSTTAQRNLQHSTFELQ
ncbi:hypothetical protein [Nostoc sp. CHAB 5715]|uniref:hypothetical protein n=1 Tax=Nostoc sp. CHAB 5715 TaxID=2780400 RepID=UPI001E51F1FD|nr:hypothetical protein [Nostoc sp. CHAB 5715]MCC5626153.1 hypothetical protein [Nostoc sp. CHAB 5715]